MEVMARRVKARAWPGITCSFGDMDNDGMAELVIGGYDSFENTGVCGKRRITCPELDHSTIQFLT